MFNFSALKLNEINPNCNFTRNRKVFFTNLKKPNYPSIYTLQIYHSVKWTSDKRAVCNVNLAVLNLSNDPKCKINYFIPANFLLLFLDVH